ncbi:TPA: DUF1488 domain-containing protein [Aeromonas dhakensis]|mgnify:FL=1|uniref:Uncharacterized protein n=2 Tax=Aeromonadaceae TaxID=84642 RepID=K1J788_9GAMM|nr:MULTISPECIES: DUF1488 domain-containing protein [Aeromonas]AHV37029.1 transcriptional regulator [Aeromonas hydrophila YL17]KMK91186.1 transcriptional regulator [Aeromonas enteropelogenes]MDD9308865.1 DUF1488 domain-containing protein [Aeromonas hydrophila]ASX10194.1 DUF1488 domain-containing protein [Aeromonas dhakensis]EIM1709884.1 DUF1488 domain-containing protein [Aeromonas dhakensis]
MNQGILFPELADWQPHEQRIHFPAQQMGALVDCYISRRRLEKMTGLSLAREEDILRAFESVRFDIEEMAEKLIEEQEFAEDGAIYL